MSDRSSLLARLQLDVRYMEQHVRPLPMSCPAPAVEEPAKCLTHPAQHSCMLPRDLCACTASCTAPAHRLQTSMR